MHRTSFVHAAARLATPWASICLAILAVLQHVVDDLFAKGKLGPTPWPAMFLPPLLWAAACLGLLIAGACWIATHRRRHAPDRSTRRTAWGLCWILTSLAIACVGCSIAVDALNGYLRVV